MSAKKKTLKIERLNINDVKEHPENHREISNSALKELITSIEEFPEMMEVRPIVIDKDGFAVGGNQRLKACIELGWKEVPVIYADGFTEEQLEEFMVKDNVSSGKFKWGKLFEKFSEDKLIHWGLNTTGIVLDSSKQKEIDQNQKKIDAMEVQFNEHHDYIVFLFDNVNDYLKVISELNVKKTPTSLSPKTKTLGLGRVIPGSKLLKLLKNEN